MVDMTISTLARTLLAGSLLAGLLSGDAAADPALPPMGPIPSVRPMAAAAGVALDPARFGPVADIIRSNPLIPVPQQAPMTRDGTTFTASISSLTARPNNLRPISGGLHDALDALNAEDVDKARAIRDGMMPGSLDRHILAWAIALHGGPKVPAHDIATAATELRGWPGMKQLRANSERALYREQLPAQDVVAAFGSSKPETPQGAMALAQAWLSLGQAGRAKALIAKTWRDDDFDRDTEEAIYKRFGSLLTRADHRYRMDRLLYGDHVNDAGRVAALAGAKELYAARAAAIRGDANAGRLLAAVPASQRSDPGYLLAQVEYLRKQHEPEKAAAVLMRAPRDPATLIDPSAWWNERRIVSRDLLDIGKDREAYLVASHHAVQDPGEAVEAEFHCGWYALRFLNDAKTAHRHFARIAEISTKPLSLSRSYYWLGRAAEAGGPGSARDYYGRAAHYATTFYGQLAAAKLGRNPDAIEYPEPTAADRARFAGREAVHAIERLQSIDYDWRANILYKDLAQELDSPGELALLAVMAERRGDHQLSLQVGKTAYWRGVDAPALAFPIGVIPADANISAAGKAMAYAIARQESAFNPSARSAAGAIGLLQLMPATAKKVAKEAGMPYSLSRLTTDVAYNATLGSHFLGEQIDRFDGSYVLTFAAYNAGPRRAQEWIDRFGDPRGKPIDEVVDWVERIPFSETRNYVQRVMENYEVYKMRLNAGFDIVHDLRFGRTG